MVVTVSQPCSDGTTHIVKKNLSQFFILSIIIYYSFKSFFQQFFRYFFFQPTFLLKNLCTILWLLEWSKEVPDAIDVFFHIVCDYYTVVFTSCLRCHFITFAKSSVFLIFFSFPLYRASNPLFPHSLSKIYQAIHP